MTLREKALEEALKDMADSADAVQQVNKRVSMEHQALYSATKNARKLLALSLPAEPVQAATGCDKCGGEVVKGGYYGTGIFVHEEGCPVAEAQGFRIEEAKPTPASAGEKP